VETGRTKILPERDEKVYYHWMRNIEPWCISRQLWWGHQIPVWYGPNPNAHTGSEPSGPVKICAASEAEVVQKAKEIYGKQAEITFIPSGASRQMNAMGTTLGADGAQRITSVSLSRDEDVLDTWFSSGLWPLGTLGWPEDTEELKRYFPTSVLITGFDIIFFWVARMMMMQLEVAKEVPFDTVYVHALVRDEKGRKMSKSIGNVIDPLDLIEKYGADAVRFTLTSMAAMGRDLKLSEKRVEGYRNFGTKLWNAARFAEMNGAIGGQADVPQATATVNKWIIGETARLREKVDAALEQYRFNDAAGALYAHIWGVFCDWYLEFSKPLLAEGAPEREETQAVMAWALDQCLVMAHPVMPFITEQLWGDLGERSKMLVHADWPEYGVEIADASADAEMAWVIGLIENIRSLRAEMGLSPSAKLTLALVGADDTAQGRLERNRVLIERMARLEPVQFAGEAPEGSVTLPIEGAEACLPLKGLVDVAAETARLKKALAKLEKEVGGLKGKLSNEKFLAKAPEDVVAEQRERLGTAEGELAKLQMAAARVASLG
ncbi:MAG: class I tRNA ligase family protein, partial [Pseudomonadota bacterium]